jgi:hypothetical protein
VQQFIAKHQDDVAGVLSGFDRLVLRGTLRSIAYAEGMSQYLWNNQVLLKDFGSHVEQVSHQLKAASLAEANAVGRPVRYLASAEVSKEDIARRIAAEDGITHGPVCVLTSVEPCRTFEIYRNRDTKHLELQPPPSPNPQVPVPVPLPGSSSLWVPETPVFKPGSPSRSRFASTDESG